MRKNPWRRIALTVSAMAAVLLLAASWRYLVSRGVFTSVEAKQAGQCRTIPGIDDVTDIAVDGTGKVYLASRTALYAYDGGAVERLAGTPKDFHPAALAFDQDSKVHVLFRQDNGWKISVFALKPAAATANGEAANDQPGIAKPFVLEELGRLTTDVLTDPADVAVLDGSRFYLVNRHATRTALGRWLDDAFLLARAQVLYFDGMKFVTIAKGLNSPAGIALSPDSARLYVSEDYPRTLVTFARNDFTGATSDATVLSIASGLGKIRMAKDGSLIIAARPKTGMGQVWRVKDGATELLYARRDGEIAAAAQFGRHLLIGASDGLTDCAL